MKIGFDVKPSGYFRIDAASLHVSAAAVEAMMARHHLADPSAALALEIEREAPGEPHRHPLMIAMVTEANRLLFVPPAGCA